MRASFVCRCIVAPVAAGDGEPGRGGAGVLVGLWGGGTLAPRDWATVWKWIVDRDLGGARRHRGGRRSRRRLRSRSPELRRLLRQRRLRGFRRRSRLDPDRAIPRRGGDRVYLRGRGRRPARG